MFSIGICDDEECVCAEIEAFIEPLRKSGRVTTEVFYSGEKLLKSLSDGDYFDLIFLDIELSLMNGISVGKKIRDELQNERVYIVYISSKREYAMELFSVRPLHFLVKPVSQHQIMSLVHKAMDLSAVYFDIFEFKVEQSYFRIPYGDILYFESKGRQVVVHSVKRNYQFYGKLKDIEGDMPAGFFRIHQSYLVNQLYIEEYQYDKVALVSGDALSVSGSYRKKVRSELLKNWRKR